MFNGHMDTVGVAGMPTPHQPSQQQGRLYGRGAYDMKGGVVACIVAIAAAKQLTIRGDVVLRPYGCPLLDGRCHLMGCGYPAVLFGPTGTGAHAIEEWVDLKSAHQCADIYLTTALAFCQ